MSNLNLHPLFRRSIGFNRLNDFIDPAMQSDAPNYPPYNIEKHGENNYRIVVAPSGFRQEELDIRLENKLLTILGKPENQSNDNIEFLYKGITQRAFKLSLRLDEYIEVQQANYENGLLIIDLQRIIPKEKLPRQIPISNKLLIKNEEKSVE
ncbi:MULTISPECIES: Hsp20 family protein [unclassified Acinetobacter]|uniref:Hsp20 family protein n=1 Tax=unclassified Acinetobacter TaxID=196816 RepID=UPI001C21CC8F|nr:MULTISPECIES: Hsp20 family protein [unclassified Acinetobacter]